MSTENASPQQAHDGLERAVCLILQIFACLHVSLVYELEHQHFFPLKDFAEGKVLRPYQSRMLTGWILRFGAENRFVQAIARHMPGAPQLKSPYELLFLLIAFFALLGALWATQGSLRVLTGDARFSRWASFGVLYMAIFNLVLSYGLTYTLPYDVPSLFFFCACFYFALSRRTLLYYLFFALGAFNRETICFATLFFLICEWFRDEEGRQRWKLAVHAVLQGALWAGIHLYMVRLFQENAFDSAPGRFVKNLHFLVNPGQWPLLLSLFGFTLPLLVLGFRWIGDRRIRTACLLFLPLWFLAMLVEGVLVEIRIFDELSALLVLACGLIVYHWMQSRGMRWSADTAQSQ